MVETCIIDECNHYFDAYPTEGLGECVLDSVEEGTGHRRIMTSMSICLNKPEYKDDMKRCLAEAGERSNFGHPFS